MLSSKFCSVGISKKRFKTFIFSNILIFYNQWDANDWVSFLPHGWRHPWGLGVIPIHSVTHVNFDREINIFIKFTKLISSQLFPCTNSFARWLFIDQYSECVRTIGTMSIGCVSSKEIITFIHKVAHRAFDFISFFYCLFLTEPFIPLVFYWLFLFYPKLLL